MHRFLPSYHHHCFFMMSFSDHSSDDDYSHDPTLLEGCRQACRDFRMDVEPTVPATDAPQVPQPQEPAGPANSPEFYPDWVFTGTPTSQLLPGQTSERVLPDRTKVVEWRNPDGSLSSIWENPDGKKSLLTLTTDTAASGAETPYCTFSPRPKLVKKKALPGDSELSIFDIINIFRHCWFLSADHLRAQVLLAQKAEDGSIFWVEFTPQFHAHLVKCAVALVPRPIQKVKKVMFMYILELLNEESHTAFFNLSKGEQRATAAQKEKKRLARKRNCCYGSTWTVCLLGLRSGALSVAGQLHTLHIRKTSQFLI